MSAVPPPFVAAGRLHCPLTAWVSGGQPACRRSWRASRRRALTRYRHHWLRRHA